MKLWIATFHEKVEIDANSREEAEEKVLEGWGTKLDPELVSVTADDDDSASAETPTIPPEVLVMARLPIQAAGLCLLLSAADVAYGNGVLVGPVEDGWLRIMRPEGKEGETDGEDVDDA